MIEHNPIPEFATQVEDARMLLEVLRKNRISFEEARVRICQSWHCTMGKATDYLEAAEALTGTKLER